LRIVSQAPSSPEGRRGIEQGFSVVKPAADNVRRRKPLADHQALYNGFGNALAQAVEFVATPVIFLLVGLWLDHRFGTAPVLMLVFFALALVGVSVSAYYRYKAAMDREEEGKPWKLT
jgi:F0F1-type ATP synthase assembly protein I